MPLKRVGLVEWLHLAVCLEVEDLNVEGMALHIGNSVFRLRSTFRLDYEDPDLLGHGSWRCEGQPLGVRSNEVTQRGGGRYAFVILIVTTSLTMANTR